MFTTVWSKLYTLVDAISAITSVYNYGVKSGEGWYPMATITPSNTKEEVMATNSNTIDIAYDISIMVKNATIATNEASIRSIVDSVMVALRADYTLTGTAYNSRFEIERGYSNDEQPMRIAVIKAIYTLCIAI